ncbi:hypothetical protein BDV93DRAFT_562836 [Ceratobasidium sp. AG-I]|nr:hypothetical protein BDV93DRAFT_562836 [Ceratobasidium sp. AG-I]
MVASQMNSARPMQSQVALTSATSYQPPPEHPFTACLLSEPLDTPPSTSLRSSQITHPRLLSGPPPDLTPEPDSDSSNESDDSEPGEFPAFDKRRIKTKEQRRRERETSSTRPRTQRQRKRDNNLNRGSLSDIDPKHQPLVSEAIEIYTAILLEMDPLGLEPAKPLARIAMRQASADDGTLLLKPNRFVIRLMSARNVNARKPFVKMARQLTPSYYGFSGQPGEPVKEINQRNCTELLHNGRFLAANHTLPDIVGPYLCPIFFSIIKRCCFGSKNSIGTRVAGRWNAVSLQFLAFLATVDQHCIAEWETGECIESPFSVKNHETTFLGHLEKLQRQQNEGRTAMDTYCKSLVERSQKLPQQETCPSVGVSDDVIKDWSTRYEVTSSNLIRDSLFAGGMAYGMQQVSQPGERILFSESREHVPSADLTLFNPPIRNVSSVATPVPRQIHTYVQAPNPPYNSQTGPSTPLVPHPALQTPSVNNYNGAEIPWEASQPGQSLGCVAGIPHRRADLVRPIDSPSLLQNHSTVRTAAPTVGPARNNLWSPPGNTQAEVEGENSTGARYSALSIDRVFQHAPSGPSASQGSSHHLNSPTPSPYPSLWDVSSSRRTVVSDTSHHQLSNAPTESEGDRIALTQPFLLTGQDHLSPIVE